MYRSIYNWKTVKPKLSLRFGKNVFETAQQVVMPCFLSGCVKHQTRYGPLAASGLEVVVTSLS